MKLLRADIRGFGKFYQTSFAFQDGLHILCGPNEAGKSTLHTFIGCMLFGLERGRGRAARTGLYARYLPWDHDAVYGGSLAFETDDVPCLVERSFRADTRSCTLSVEGKGRTDCPDLSLPPEYLEGLTESFYYNTISIRQVKAGPDSSFAEELARSLSGVEKSGSDRIDFASASSSLKAQKKELESRLSPDLEGRILALRLQGERLAKMLEDDSFRSEKERLAKEMDECAEELEEASVPARARPEKRRASSAPGGRVLCLLLFLAALFAAGFLLQKGQAAPAAAAGILSLLFLILSFIGKRRKAPEEEPEEEEEKEGDAEDTRAGSRIRARLKSLEQQYNEACRKEWKWEQCLEQWQNNEE